MMLEYGKLFNEIEGSVPRFLHASAEKTAKDNKGEETV